MSRTKTALALATFALCTGCGSEAGSPNDSGGSAQCVSQLDANGNLMLSANAANNYQFSSSLAISTVKVKPNAELFIDWGGLNQDLLKHTLDPKAGVDMVMMVVWNLTIEQVQQKLNADQLGASFAESAAALYPMHTVTNGSIFNFVVPGTTTVVPREELMPRLDPTKFDPASHSYTIMPAVGTVPGEGVKMVQGFSLDPASTNQNVAVTPASTALTYDAKLTTLTPVGVPSGTAKITVDWSTMTVNALGREWLTRSVDSVMVAQFSQSLGELQTRFLDLEQIAQKMYRGEVAAGDSIAFTDLKDDNGQPFAGIDSSGTWILALKCGRCANPAPWYLTELQTCSAK